MKRLLWLTTKILGTAMWMSLLSALTVQAEDTNESFDGSFQLESGEIITGGYFVESGQARYLYMDTESFAKGGLFRRVNEHVLKSIFPPEQIEIEFLADADGHFNTLLWREHGNAEVRGKRVFPHRTRDIQFNSSDGSTLRGYLMLPECQGPYPTIVSVHGSGPVNRYGGPYHTVFLQQGMAVLAYDKRGYTADKSAWREPDLRVLANDAAAAVRFASQQPELDAKRIGIFGASQAGWVVPQAAVNAPEAAFVILRAGAALSHLENYLHERRQELRKKGLKGLDLDYAVSLLREVYQVAIAGEPITTTDPLLQPYLNEPWYRASFGEGVISKRWSAHWWTWAQHNMAHSSLPFVQQLKSPVLWFLAEHDENVPLVSTHTALTEALRKAPGRDHELRIVHGAQHSFLMPQTDGPPQFTREFFGPMMKWLQSRGLTSHKACSNATPHMSINH